MIDAITFLFAVAGFALLLLASSKAQRDWIRRRVAPTHNWTVRASGFTLLALSFGAAALELGLGYGAVAWLGWLTVAAILVVAVHVNRDRVLRWVRR